MTEQELDRLTRELWDAAEVDSLLSAGDELYEGGDPKDPKKRIEAVTEHLRECYRED